MAEKTIAKIDKNEIAYNITKNRTTKEQLQRDYGYFITQKLLKGMLDKGLISIDEFNQQRKSAVLRSKCLHGAKPNVVQNYE